MKKMPKEILVYQCDELNGQPIYAAVLTAQEIPEDVTGQKVGIYILNHSATFTVRRELK